MVATFPSLCFLVQSATIANFSEHFGIDRRVVVGGCRSSWPWLGPGLVGVVCALPGLFRQFFTIARTRETLRYPSPCHSS